METPPLPHLHKGRYQRIKTDIIFSNSPYKMRNSLHYQFKNKSSKSEGGVTKNGESHVYLTKDELQTFKMAAVQTLITNKSLLKENYTFWVGRP